MTPDASLRMPTLVAVIGPVEPGLLRAFADHYRSLGITRMLIGFHFTGHATAAQRYAVLSSCRQVIGPPALISTGPWHEHLHSDLRDRLRAQAGPGWHLIADSDEFHTYPAPIPDMITAAVTAGSAVVGGVLLDRITADGRLDTARTIRTAAELDRAYPLAGFLTHKLLHADPRKIVLAHSSVRLELGSHRSPGNRPLNQPLVAVHHFKWRPGIDQDLRRRVTHHGDGSWNETTPAIRTEAGRMLTHLDDHGGRIDTTAPGLDFRPATLPALPDWWTDQARRVAQQFLRSAAGRVTR